MNDAFYYGSLRYRPRDGKEHSTGHHLWNVDLDLPTDEQESLLAAALGLSRIGLLDQSFAPGAVWRDGFLERPLLQPEGIPRLTHLYRWTVLSFWDRSADDRHGSHSTFVLRGTLSMDAAIAKARESFPKVWARYKFNVETPANGTAAR